MRLACPIFRNVRSYLTVKSRRYNPPTNLVHHAACVILVDFDTERQRASERAARADSRRFRHRCALCRGRTCALCLDKCLSYEIPALVCGGPCAQRMKRETSFHVTRDGLRLWCHKCYLGLKSVIPAYHGAAQASTENNSGYKRDLLKRCFEGDATEAWVQCDMCASWTHQTCALFNPWIQSDVVCGMHVFMCPPCQLRNAQVYPAARQLPLALLAREATPARLPRFSSRQCRWQSTSFRTLCGSLNLAFGSLARGVLCRSKSSRVAGLPTCSELPSACVTDAQIRRGWWMAAALPETALSSFVQQQVRSRMNQLGGIAAEFAVTLCVRVVSCFENSFRVPSVVRNAFITTGGGSVPAAIPYVSKVLVLFQRIDGVDLCVFCMYLQEFDRQAPAPSARHVYVAYLDSVEYFRPRAARTVVYHEIFIAYLQWTRDRGFVAAHLWACPPQRGNDFVFWCHPPYQRTPSRERLLAWYRSMFQHAFEAGAVERISNLYDLYFKHLDAPKKKSHKVNSHKRRALSAAELPKQPPLCPPVFDGDFWVDEACRLHSTLGRRRGVSGSKRQSVEAPIDENHLASIASPLAECLALVRYLLAQPSAYPFQVPVDPVALRIPDYFTVIHTPMDLGTVLGKLTDNAYVDVQSAIDDLRLIFRNAQTYNPPRHPIHDVASNLSRLFELKLKSILAYWRSQGITLSSMSPSASVVSFSYRLRGDIASFAALPSESPISARLPAEVAASVGRMKECLFVLHLQSPNICCDDPDRGVSTSSPLIDFRQTFLVHSLPLPPPPAHSPLLAARVCISCRHPFPTNVRANAMHEP